MFSLLCDLFIVWVKNIFFGGAAMRGTPAKTTSTRARAAGKFVATDHAEGDSPRRPSRAARARTFSTVLALHIPYPPCRERRPLPPSTGQYEWRTCAHEVAESLETVYYNLPPQRKSQRPRSVCWEARATFAPTSSPTGWRRRARWSAARRAAASLVTEVVLRALGWSL